MCFSKPEKIIRANVQLIIQSLNLNWFFYLRSDIIVCASPEFNLFQPSVAFHIKTSHLIWNATLSRNKLIICKRSDCALCYLFLIISQEYLSQESDPQNCTASWSICYCLSDILETYKSSTKVSTCHKKICSRMGLF